MSDDESKIENNFEISGLEKIDSCLTQDKRGMNFDIEYMKFHRYPASWNSLLQTTSSVGFTPITTSSVWNSSLYVCSSVMVPYLAHTTNSVSVSTHSYRAEVSGLYLSKKVFGSFVESDN